MFIFQFLFSANFLLFIRAFSVNTFEPKDDINNKIGIPELDIDHTLPNLDKDDDDYIIAFIPSENVTNGEHVMSAALAQKSKFERATNENSSYISPSSFFNISSSNIFGNLNINSTHVEFNNTNYFSINKTNKIDGNKKNSSCCSNFINNNGTLKLKIYNNTTSSSSSSSNGNNSSKLSDINRDVPVKLVYPFGPSILNLTNTFENVKNNHSLSQPAIDMINQLGNMTVGLHDNMQLFGEQLKMIEGGDQFKFLTNLMKGKNGMKIFADLTPPQVPNRYRPQLPLRRPYPFFKHRLTYPVPKKDIQNNDVNELIQSISMVVDMAYRFRWPLQTILYKTTQGLSVAQTVVKKIAQHFATIVELKRQGFFEPEKMRKFLDISN